MGRKAIWPPKMIPHKSSGLARVQWQGHTYYLGPIGSPESRERYCELIRELQGEGGAGGAGASRTPAPLEPGKGTVTSLVLLWMVHAQREHTLEERDSYRVALRPVLALYGTCMVEEFDSLALRRVQQAMAERGLCRNVVNRRVGRIRTVWRWAEMEKLASAGTWAALRAVPPLTRPRPGLRESPRVQPVEHWRAMRTAFLGATGPGLRLLILLGWWTGARPGELVSLDSSMICTDGDTWTARLERHKNAWRGQERVIHFGPEARALLESRLSENPTIICPDGKGGRFNRRSLYQALRRACDRAGVQRWHAYQLRHAFRRRVARTIGSEAARVLMGQRSVGASEQYATGIDAKLAEESAKKAG